MTTKQSDAWIFISHSTRDLAAVRKVRNAIEEKGANPILFFLKQKVPDDLLRSFLLREIEARNFFLLCESENASLSPYVQFEVDHVKKLPHVKRNIVNISLPWEAQLAAIEDLLADATAFASYAVADRDAVAPFLQFLADQDFAVFDPIKDLRLGDNWQTAIQRAISESSRSGYLIQFLSRKALQSQFVAAEFNYYLQASGGGSAGRHPVLIALEPIAGLTLPPQVAQYQIIDASAAPFAATCDRIKRVLGL